MKIVDSESTPTRLKVKTQVYHSKIWDLGDNYLPVYVFGLLIFSGSMTLSQYQVSLSDLVPYFIVGVVISFIQVMGLLLYANSQADASPNIVGYIVDKEEKVLYAEIKKIFSTTTKLKRIIDTDDIKSVYLEILTSSISQRQDTNMATTEYQTAYRIQLKPMTGKESMLEYNSIESFSHIKTKLEFQNLITQSTEAIQRINQFLAL